MPGGMPILGLDNMLELRRNAMNHVDHGIAIGHGQRAAQTEIVLNVDNDQYVLRSDLDGFSPGTCLVVYSLGRMQIEFRVLKPPEIEPPVTQVIAALPPLH